jgi:polyisoprenoid-binding protein YceI
LPALVLLVALPGVLPAPAGTAEVYTVDQAHSLLDFTVRLIGLNRVRGRFKDWRADFTYDPANPAGSSVTFFAEVNSIDTEEDERDEHLRSRDFFDAEQFPLIRFQSTAVTASGKGLEIEGDLTIRGVTRRIRFPAGLLFPDQRDLFGNRRVVFGASLTLDRRDFGVNGPRFWSLAIADEVTIEMEIAGRIWEYSRIGFGRPDAVIGARLLAAADSGQLDRVLLQTRIELANQPDSLPAPTAAEIRTAAMRLYQQHHLAEAIKVFDFGFAMAGTRWPAEARAANLIGLAEVLYRSGNVAGAGERIAEALVLDSTNTQAIEWQRLIRSGGR